MIEDLGRQRSKQHQKIVSLASEFPGAMLVSMPSNLARKKDDGSQVRPERRGSLSRTRTARAAQLAILGAVLGSRPFFGIIF